MKKETRRVELGAGMVEAVKQADHLLASRDKEGLPDLPPGHPALRAILAQRQMESLERQGITVRKGKKATAKKTAEADEKSSSDRKRRASETAELVGKIYGKVTDLDSSLREIFDMSVTCNELMKDDPSLRVRFGRLSRLVFSFHAAMRDCCSPMARMAEKNQRAAESEREG